MIVERFVSRPVLGSSLTGLALVLSSSVALGQQQQPSQQPEQQPLPGQQQSQSQQSEQQRPQQQQAQQSAQQQQQQQQQQETGQQDVEVAAAAPAGQQTQPMWSGVRMIEVKHDRIGEFEGLLKELGMAMQEAGQPGFEVWTTELGELGTYHIVSPIESFSSLGNTESAPMEPTEWANWMNRVQATIDEHTALVAMARPDLSIVPPEAQQGQQLPELMLLITDKVLPGKAQEFETHVRDEIVPALRQSDIPGFFANEITFGAEARTWVFAVPLEDWSRLDQPSPFVEVLGPQGAEELMLRGDQLIESSEMLVLRYREDLSSQPSQ